MGDFLRLTWPLVLYASVFCAVVFGVLGALYCIHRGLQRLAWHEGPEQTDDALTWIRSRALELPWASGIQVVVRPEGVDSGHVDPRRIVELDEATAYGRSGQAYKAAAWALARAKVGPGGQQALPGSVAFAAILSRATGIGAAALSGGFLFGSLPLLEIGAWSHVLRLFSAVLCFVASLNTSRVAASIRFGSGGSSWYCWLRTPGPFTTTKVFASTFFWVEVLLLLALPALCRGLFAMSEWSPQRVLPNEDLVFAGLVSAALVAALAWRARQLARSRWAGAGSEDESSSHDMRTWKERLLPWSLQFGLLVLFLEQPFSLVGQVIVAKVVFAYALLPLFLTTGILFVSGFVLRPIGTWLWWRLVSWFDWGKERIERRDARESKRRRKEARQLEIEERTEGRQTKRSEEERIRWETANAGVSDLSLGLLSREQTDGVWSLAFVVAVWWTVLGS